MKVTASVLNQVLDEYNDYSVSDLQVSREWLEVLRFANETEVIQESLKPMIKDTINLVGKFLDLVHLLTAPKKKVFYCNTKTSLRVY